MTLEYSSELLPLKVGTTVIPFSCPTVSLNSLIRFSRIPAWTGLEMECQNWISTGEEISFTSVSSFCVPLPAVACSPVLEPQAASDRAMVIAKNKLTIFFIKMLLL